ncbi:MAG: transporter substrate-binding domain-containing protein [Oscillospiraceae bacterium]
MKKKLSAKLFTPLLSAGLALVLTACGSAAAASSAAAQSTGQPESAGEAAVTTITFGYRNTGAWPVYGQDDNGEPTGYDIEVLRLVDEALPGYEFEYVGTSYEDVYVGIEAGNFDGALTNAFWTEERAKKYLIPEENIGASVLILGVRNENADIKNLADLSASGLKLAPILAGNGMYYVVKSYNESNPNQQVEITTTDNATFVAGSVEELAAGRYDAIIDTKPQWEANFTAEDGVNHTFFDQVSYSEFDLALTYPLFNQSVGEDFVKEFSDALKSVKDSGKASELSIEFLGYDIFNYEFK